MTKKKSAGGEEYEGFDEFDPYAPSISEQLETIEHAQREKAYAEIDRRKLAYARVFSGKCEQADVDAVMKDLAWFSRLFTSTFNENERVHALLEGRREVVQRIVDFARLDRDALFKKYTGSR